MVTSIKNLKTEVDNRLSAGGLSALACCQLQNAQTILDNCIVTSVPNLASLPCSDNNEGRFVYVDDINEYRFSRSFEWTDDLSSNIEILNCQILTWGSNSCGALGDGTTTTRCSPVREICSATNWCQASAGSQMTAAIKTGGELWTWGQNLCGSLGDGTAVDKCSPVREFCSATNWCQVSAGDSHMAAVKTIGELWVWGNNLSNRLGDGTAVGKCSPVREICSATDWCQVSAGVSNTAAIKTSGQMWAWGFNSCGRLGDGTTVTRCSPVREICSATDWCQVSSAGYHAAAIKTNGQLWAWGRNSNGVLGVGTTVQSCSPVREISSAMNWCQVSVGFLHTAAVKTSSQIWTWGDNRCGRLGDGTTTDRCSPVRERCSATDWCQVSAGDRHTAAIKTSGQIWTWGSNSCGQLGDGTVTSRCSPVRERCSVTDWCQVSGGVFHTAAVKITIKGFLE